MKNNFQIPKDINNHKTIIPAPESVGHHMKIGIYKGGGSGEGGIHNFRQNVSEVLDVEIIELKADDLITRNLSQFDVLVFSGGSGSKQAESIGEEGKENIRKYVKDGGSYLGICAGAYLATSGFEWSLGILNARTISTTEWKRGEGFVDLEIADEARNVLGDVKGLFKCRYANGPLLKLNQKSELPHATPALYFRSEISENGVTSGVMADTPAAVFGGFGEGKIFVMSPHAENTPGLENLIPRMLLWLVRN